MNILLVHGSYGKPFENWFPWLEDELAKKVFLVLYHLFRHQSIKIIMIGRNC